MNNSIFQNIFDECVQYLDSKWEELVVYLEYGEASYTFSFYERINGRYVKCFDIPSINEKELMNSFRKIDRMVSAERNKEKGEIWTNMTMVVTSDGHMKTNFDYTDLSEGTYQYMKQWKAKYLK